MSIIPWKLCKQRLNDNNLQGIVFYIGDGLLYIKYNMTNLQYND